MEVFMEQQGNTRTLRIQGDMTIYTAAPLKQHFADALQGSNDLEIDLSAVQAMDSTGLQLLYLIKREAQKRGKKLSLVRHSPAIMQVLDLFNMSAYFGDPVVIPAR